jgi:hypothetical protein
MAGMEAVMKTTFSISVGDQIPVIHSMASYFPGEVYGL